MINIKIEELIMIHTSYFANIKNLKNRKLISISQITPHWADISGEYKALAPTKSILFGYKNEEISDEEYTKRYREEVLSKLDPRKVYDDLNGSVLLCYEKRGDFCHRNIVSDWLLENGFKSKEVLKCANVAIIGSRDFNDSKTAFFLIDQLAQNYETIKLVSGGARGADKIAEDYAKERGIDIEIFPADWDKHGKSAGFIRNQEIWDKSDLGLAFWDGKSKGTSHSFKIAEKQNKELFVFNYIDNKFINIKDL